MNIALYILLGAALGVAIGWLLRSVKPPAPNTRVEEELRQQRGSQEVELIRLRNELTEAASSRAGADSTKAAAETALTEQRQLLQQALANAEKSGQDFKLEINQLRETLSQSSTELASLKAQLTADRKSLAESQNECGKTRTVSAQLQEQLLTLKKRNGELEAEVKFLNERLTTERQQIETVQAKFRADFEAISNKLLVDNTSKFNQQSSESLEKLLSPLRETFGEFKKSLETTRTETATHSALLKDQISRIGTEAANLSKALKGDVKALGNWGENMLDQILEKSGLQSGLHYRRHSTLADIYLKRMPASEVEVEYGERFQGLLSLIPGHRGLRSVGARLDSDKIAALASDQNSILDADDIANEHRQRLKESLNTLRGKRDLVIIDTPPDLGFEMTTALIASDWFVIPVFPSGYDLKGLETLARTVEKIRKRYNPNLRLAGVLLGNYDKTAKLDADIHKALVKKFGEDLVFRTTIARSVKHRESTLYRRTIFEHAPSDQASIQYAELVKEMINRGAKGAFGATVNPLPDETALVRMAPEVPETEDPGLGRIMNG